MAEPAGSARKLFEALRMGLPINGDEGFDILSPSYAKAINAVINEVVRSRGLGPSRIRKVYWVTGRPGNGKTQSLRQFTSQLPSLEGAGKYAFASIDFDEEPVARSAEALVPAIVRHSLSGSVAEEVKPVRDWILQDSSVDPTVKESVSLGVDVVSNVAGLGPASLFVGAGFSGVFAGLGRLMRYLRGRERYIKKKLREKWSSNPQLLQLLSAWVRYIMDPTPRREAEFSTVLTTLATTGTLFDLFCYALEQANYSTVVLAFDEVDKVVLENLKPLWDPPERGSDRPYHELNIILVIAAREHLYHDLKADEALYRRFCTTKEGHQTLRGPRVDQIGSDDFDHIYNQVEQLLNKAPHLRKDDPGQNGDERAKIRDELPREDITWQILWERIIEHKVRI